MFEQTWDSPFFKHNYFAKLYDLAFSPKAYSGCIPAIFFSHWLWVTGTRDSALNFL